MRIFPILLSSLLSASALAAENTKATLHIDASQPRQTITGFGGFAFSATWGTNLTDASISAMFSCDNSSSTLGYNIVRARISPDSVASWGADCWNPTIEVMKKARNATEKNPARKHYNFASAWTPPGKFTSNGQNTHGYILESKFGEYTDFLNCFIHRVERMGTDVDYISLQNEPDWSPDYEGCVWSAQNFNNYYTNYATQLDRPLLGPEYLGFSPNRIDSILNNDAACANLAIVAGHIYGAGNFDYPLVRQKGKEKWMSEFLDEEGTKDANGNVVAGHVYSWKDAIHFGRIVNTSMLANFNAWVHYALKSSYGMIGDGTHGTQENVITKRGYVLANFAKYCTGTTRVHTTLTEEKRQGLSASAYMSVTGDTCVVVVLNPGSSKVDITFDLPFVSGRYARILTASSYNLNRSDNLISPATETPVLTVPRLSVSTYLFIKSGERTVAQEPVHQPLWADSLQNYNGQCVHPAGWTVTVDGTVYTTSSGNSFYWDGRPQLYPYSPESPIQMGIKLKASASNKAGQALYGGQNGYRLSLEPGNYRLIWHGVGYDHEQKLYAFVRRAGTTSNIAYHSGVATPGHMNGGWGSAKDNFNEAVSDTLDFTIETAGNYELGFKVTYYAENVVNGACRALVGGITLDYAPEVSAIQEVKAAPIEAEDTYYDLLGNRVDEIMPGRIYFTGSGRKFIAR